MIYSAPKKKFDEEFFTLGKKLINTYYQNSKFSEFEKERRLKDLEVIFLLDEGIYILGKEVEFLATGEYKSDYSQDEDLKKAREYFQRLIYLNPHDSKLHLALELALRIIKEQKNEEQALKDLNIIRQIISKYLAEAEDFSRFKSIPPHMMDPSKGKMAEMIRAMKYITNEFMKNEMDYKNLENRKNAGELVDNMIRENKSYAEILKKKESEYSSEALKWMESGNGIELLKILEREDPTNFDKIWNQLKYVFTSYETFKKLEDEWYERYKPLTSCRKCGKRLPLKSLRILLEKKRVYCPNCGRIVYKS